MCRYKSCPPYNLSFNINCKNQKFTLILDQSAITTLCSWLKLKPLCLTFYVHGAKWIYIPQKFPELIPWSKSNSKSCMRSTTKTRPVRKYLWRLTSSPWVSLETHPWWARLFWGTHLDLGRDSWSTRGLEICLTKEVKEHVNVRIVPSFYLLNPVMLNFFSCRPTGKYVTTVTEFGCVPVTFSYQTPDYGWLGTRSVYIHNGVSAEHTSNVVQVHWLLVWPTLDWYLMFIVGSQKWWIVTCHSYVVES